MKINKFFIIAVTLFIAMILFSEIQSPRRFSWNLTYNPEDDNPFGTILFDSIMKSSMPKGYDVTNKTLYQLSTDGHKGRRNILVLGGNVSLSHTDFKALMNMARSGDNIMFITDGTKTEKESDILGFNTYCEGFFYNSFKMKFMEKQHFDTIRWCCNNGYSQRDFYINNNLYGYSECDIDPKIKIIPISAIYTKDIYDRANDSIIKIDGEEYTSNNIVAGKRIVGKGAIMFNTISILFTNYGILYSKNLDYIMRTMNLISNAPVVRTYAYTKLAYKDKQSPFRYLLSKAPLQWALYLTLTLILLLMFFTARRRQRVIPIIKAPKDRSLEYARHIGSLFFKYHDNKDLVRREFSFLAAEMRRKNMIDITNKNEDETNFRVIAAKSGLEENVVKNFIRIIRLHTSEDVEKLSDTDMMNDIDMINSMKK